VRPVGRSAVLSATLCALAFGAPCGCAEGLAADARSEFVVSTLARADQVFARTRPALLAGKYARMAQRPYDFYRGTFPLFLADVRDPRATIGDTRFAVDGPLPLALGDAHPENFGVLVAGDGSLAIEPNDFDAADRWPYHWDLRRLITGVLVGARESKTQDPAALAAWRAAEPEVARAIAEAYAETITALAAGEVPSRLDAPGSEPILTDLFARSMRDLNARAELTELTDVDAAGVRRLKRGSIDAEDPQSVLADLPEFARADVEGAIDAYRRSLVAPPDPASLRVLDAVREFGSGVASWPRIRVLVLVAGPTNAAEDDEVLEIKELADSGARAWFPPGLLARDVGARIRRLSRLAWAREDAESRWGTSQWLGLPVQVRREAEGQKNVRVVRWVGARGTVEAIRGAGAALARLLARIHAVRLEGVDAAGPIAAVIGRDPVGFADEQAAACIAYATQVSDDHARFLDALRTRGPTLGVVPTPGDAPLPDFAAVLGTPPLPTPLPESP
jgi:uncharacterized protein (DUF2252 family)